MIFFCFVFYVCACFFSSFFHSTTIQIRALRKKSMVSMNFVPIRPHRCCAELTYTNLFEWMNKKSVQIREKYIDMYDSHTNRHNDLHFCFIENRQRDREIIRLNDWIDWHRHQYQHQQNGNAIIVIRRTQTHTRIQFCSFVVVVCFFFEVKLEMWSPNAIYHWLAICTIYIHPKEMSPFGLPFPFENEMSKLYTHI